MTTLIPVVAVGPLRQRLIDEMDIERFGHETQRNYIRDVGRFATFLGACLTGQRRKMSSASRSSSVTWRCQR